MKKTMALILAAICISVLCGCGPTPQTETEETEPIFTKLEETEPTFVLARVPAEKVPGFSYEEDTAVYLSDDIEFSEKTEIKQTGFRIVTKCAVTDTVEAFERAKVECSISYDEMAVFYDSSADMWLVFFFTSETNGLPSDRQSVYLDGDGITRLIVTSSSY